MGQHGMGSEKPEMEQHICLRGGKDTLGFLPARVSSSALLIVIVRQVSWVYPEVFGISAYKS